MNKDIKISIQEKLKNKVFLVDSEKDWEKILLILSPYCKVISFEDYLKHYPIFEPLYLRITDNLLRNSLLSTGWGHKKDKRFYQEYDPIVELNPWFNIL